MTATGAGMMGVEEVEEHQRTTDVEGEVAKTTAAEDEVARTTAGVARIAVLVMMSADAMKTRAKPSLLVSHRRSNPALPRRLRKRRVRRRSAKKRNSSARKTSASAMKTADGKRKRMRSVGAQMSAVEKTIVRTTRRIARRG